MGGEKSRVPAVRVEQLLLSPLQGRAGTAGHSDHGFEYREHTVE